MDQHNGHGELVMGFLKEQKEVFESSDQGVYVFLDDDCRACNQKFASMLGYESPEEWFKVDVQGAFPATFVDNRSQTALVGAYQEAMEKLKGSSVKVTWKKKSGGTVNTNVVLVPVAFKGHLFALHFVDLA